jgi:hypothetical protein
MFDRVQVRALAGPLKDRDLPQNHACIVLAVCLGSLSYWKVNLRPNLRSWALWSRSYFIYFLNWGSLYFALFIFAYIQTSLSVPATEKHPHSITMLHRRGWCQVSSLRNACIQAKEFNLGFIRPENLVSHGLIVFRCLLANSKRAVMYLLLKSGFRLATLP